MKLLTLLFISGLALFLSSCDCIYEYSYEVENQSSSSIKVKWESHSYTTSGLMDSVEISPGNTQNLFMSEHGIEACKGGPFYRDVSFDLVSIQITKGDSVGTKLDFMANEQWDFEEGVYRAVVTDAAF